MTRSALALRAIVAARLAPRGPNDPTPATWKLLLAHFDDLLVSGLLGAAAVGNSRQRRSAERSRLHKEKQLEAARQEQQHKRLALIGRVRLALLKSIWRHRLAAMRVKIKALNESKEPLMILEKEHVGDKRTKWSDYSSDDETPPAQLSEVPDDGCTFGGADRPRV